MKNLIPGYCFSGSALQWGLTQPSSHVGKSTIATMLRDQQGYKICSLADEIRYAITGDLRYGSIEARNRDERPVENSEMKMKLVKLGEGFNSVERYGWVSMALCKMLLAKGAFIVDDVRRLEEITLLQFFGMTSVEIARTDGMVKQYPSDGRIAQVSDLTLVNNKGVPLEFTIGWFKSSEAWDEHEPDTQGVKGLLRSIYHLASGETKFELLETPAFRVFMDPEVDQKCPQMARMALEQTLNVFRDAAKAHHDLIEGYS